MKCHNCKTSMTLTRSASSERSETEWFKCPLCNAEHMSTRLVFNGNDDVDLDPYSQYVDGGNQSLNANDDSNFTLRQQEYH